MAKPILYLVRREHTGIGGAEKAAKRFISGFSNHFNVVHLHAGKIINGFLIRGNAGPNWLKCILFAYSVNRFLGKLSNVKILSMERGVPGTIYRVGDGIHEVWLKIKYQNSKRWIVNPLHWIMPNLEKKSITESKYLVPNSHMVASQIKDVHQVAETKIHVIENGFNPKLFFYANEEKRANLRKELKVNPNIMNLLFVGSGWERKGLYYAISFLYELKQSNNVIHLWVAGLGNQRKYVSLINSLGLMGEVTFLGSVQDIQKWYQVADIMILPTLYDPFSNSCLESLACGCPVLTTKSNGVATIITRGNSGVITDGQFIDTKTVLPRLKELRCNNTRSSLAKSVLNYTTSLEINKYIKILND